MARRDQLYIIFEWLIFVLYVCLFLFKTDPKLNDILPEITELSERKYLVSFLPKLPGKLPIVSLIIYIYPIELEQTIQQQQQKGDLLLIKIDLSVP